MGQEVLGRVHTPSSRHRGATMEEEGRESPLTNIFVYITGNIPWNIVNPTYHCHGSELTLCIKLAISLYN